MTQTYQGGCHCGLVRYRIETDLGQPVMECNCSYCSKAGTLWQFVSGDAFTLEKGEDSLTEYLFNTQTIKHQFCKVCGIESFAYGEKDGQRTVALNARTVDGIDLGALTRTQVNGKDF